MVSIAIKSYARNLSMTYKYYNGEDKSPYPENDIRSKFWWGEMMFDHSQQSVERWMEEGKLLLENANEQTKQIAKNYTPEQFGVVMYISNLFAKWCPYDDQQWITEY